MQDLTQAVAALAELTSTEVSCVGTKLAVRGKDWERPGFAVTGVRARYTLVPRREYAETKSAAPMRRPPQHDVAIGRLLMKLFMN